MNYNIKMAGYNDKIKGYDVEDFVIKKFVQEGFKVTRIDDYYNLKLEFCNKILKIEIKSCNFMIKKDFERLN